MVFQIFISSIFSHSFITSPVARGNKKELFAHCSRGQNCIQACDSSINESDIGKPWFQAQKVSRGSTLKVKWNRNNHPGGFTRIAMAPIERSDDPAAFDDGVLQFSCYESHCQEDHHDEILGDYNGSGNGNCYTEIQIPTNYPDGSIATMQWTWFGGGVYIGDTKGSFANYVNCADLIIDGGKPYSPVQKGVKRFVGGDLAGLSDKCRYWGSNNIHGCPAGLEDGNLNGCGRTGMKIGAPDGF